MRSGRRVVALVGTASVLLRGVAALRLGSAAAKVNWDGYSFESYLRDFGRDRPIAGSAERARRNALFQSSLAEIRATNARNLRDGRPWVAGAHPFMDWTVAERKVLNGYKPSRRLRPVMAALQTDFQQGGRLALNATERRAGGLTINEGPKIRQQGNCGSCWAISAVEAVEAALLMRGVKSPQLSAQALVDCVPNPKHCGGTGGCDGATGELAFQFMKDYGIPTEAEDPYTEETGVCSESLSGPWPGKQRARVSGFTSLPSNQAQPLMQALVQEGPVTVAVDGGDWYQYGGGIFDGCQKDAELSHAVLAKGYGTDHDFGHSYWLIQNSWGSRWGERGHIRLLKHDDEDAWCGVDHKPQDGVGCDGGPAQVTVCGMCGLLYDPVVPTGVRLEDGSSSELGSNAGQASSAPTINEPQTHEEVDIAPISATDMYKSSNL